MTTREFTGSFKEIRRNIISEADDDHRSCYMGMDGRVTKESANRSGNDGSGDLGASSAAERVATWLAEFNTLGGLDNQVAHIANRTPLYVDDLWALVRAVRVSEDDTTVDRVAQAMRAGEVGDNARYLPAWEHLGDVVQERFRDMARAAVRALREATTGLPVDEASEEIPAAQAAATGGRALREADE